MLAPEFVRRAVEAHGPFVTALYGGELERHEGFDLLHNRHVDEREWNHVGRLRVATGAFTATIAEARRALAAVRRPLTVVSDPFALPADLEQRLNALGWEESFRHSGLTWAGKTLRVQDVSWPEGVVIEEMSSGATLRDGAGDAALDFVAALIAVFEESFLDGAAGHLSAGYRGAFPQSLRPRLEGVEVVHSLVRVAGEPAAIGSRAIGSGVAGLYNLGVAPRFRRLGLGGAVTLHRVAAAQATGAEVVYLLTEDPRVEQSQLRRGFTKAFELVGLAAPE